MDMIKIEFINEAFSYSSDGRKTLNLPDPIYRKIPKLAKSEAEIVILEVATSTIEKATRTILFIQILSTILVSVSLKHFWNLYNVIQVIVFLRLFIYWPGTIYEFLSSLNEQITLQSVYDYFLNDG